MAGPVSVPEPGAAAAWRLVLCQCRSLAQMRLAVGFMAESVFGPESDAAAVWRRVSALCPVGFAGFGTRFGPWPVASPCAILSITCQRSLSHFSGGAPLLWAGVGRRFYSGGGIGQRFCPVHAALRKFRRGSLPGGCVRRMRPLCGAVSRTGKHPCGTVVRRRRRFGCGVRAMSKNCR